MVLKLKEFSLKAPISGAFLHFKRSFVLNNGIKYGLTGANGSGKSLLLKALAGSVDQDHCYISGNWLGQDIQFFKPPPHLLGWVPQHPLNVLPPFVSLLKMFDTLLGGNNDRYQYWDKLAIMFDALLLPIEPKWWKRRPHQLSGGQRHKMMLALALIQQPQLLLIDEADAHLDNVSLQAMKKVLDRWIKQHNTTLLMVSHDPNMGTWFDEIIDLKQPKIIENK